MEMLVRLLFDSCSKKSFANDKISILHLPFSLRENGFEGIQEMRNLAQLIVRAKIKRMNEYVTVDVSYMLFPGPMQCINLRSNAMH